MAAFVLALYCVCLYAWSGIYTSVEDQPKNKSCKVLVFFSFFIFQKFGYGCGWVVVP